MTYKIPLSLLSIIENISNDASQKFSLKEICLKINEISENYSGVKKNIEFCKLDDELSTIAYILYFHPINFVKNLSILNEISFLDQNFLQNENAFVLDIGSGTGAFASAFLHKIFQLEKNVEKLNIVCLDKSREALKWCMYVLNRFASDTLRRKQSVQNLSIESICTNIAKNLNTSSKFDVCILSDSLIEIVESWKDCVGFLRSLFERNLKEGGYLIVLEPALMHSGKRINVIVDEFKKMNNAKILAPCISRDLCPGRSDNNFWCYKELKFSRPDYFVKIDKQIGHRKDFVRYAYIIVQKTENQTTQDKSDKKEFTLRVVGDIKKEKGYVQCLLCRGEKHITARLLKRNFSESNRSFEKIMRGDLVIIKFAKHPNFDSDFIEISEDCFIIVH